ncbi:hypothetical protein NPIL_598361 [Nephila pilipes]|uniref:Uncharacterized protein n=1 Tax=Nephila pilipes TaxID=299642 RepID=A0A8X6TGM0_NEPPI|nr:hypothetical protein NPIL_598361 [Nephila pilipes]
MEAESAVTGFNSVVQGQVRENWEHAEILIIPNDSSLVASVFRQKLQDSKEFWKNSSKIFVSTIFENREAEEKWRRKEDEYRPEREYEQKLARKQIFRTEHELKLMRMQATVGYENTNPLPRVHSNVEGEEGKSKKLEIKLEPKALQPSCVKHSLMCSI